MNQDLENTKDSKDFNTEIKINNRGNKKGDKYNSHKRLGKMEIKVAKLIAKGDTKTEVAKQVGRSVPRIHQLCQREDIKALIEQEQTRLASLVPQAVKNFEHYIASAIGAKDRIDKEIAFRATQKLLESTGILNNQPSHLVQILYQENNTVISPVIKELLGGFMDKFNNVVDNNEFNCKENKTDDIIDVTYADVRD